MSRADRGRAGGCGHRGFLGAAPCTDGLGDSVACDEQRLRADRRHRPAGDQRARNLRRGRFSDQARPNAASPRSAGEHRSCASSTNTSPPCPHNPAPRGLRTPDQSAVGRQGDCADGTRSGSGSPGGHVRYLPFWTFRTVGCGHSARAPLPSQIQRQPHPMPGASVGPLGGRLGSFRPFHGAWRTMPIIVARRSGNGEGRWSPRGRWVAWSWSVALLA